MSGRAEPLTTLEACRALESSKLALAVQPLSAGPRTSSTAAVGAFAGSVYPSVIAVSRSG